MPPVRVLVVEGSPFLRGLVSAVLDADPGIEVVGTTPDGRRGLAELDRLVPDAVTLDIETPELDAIATLAAIRACQPDLPVVLYSTLSGRGAVTALDTLSRGASDFVRRPADVSGAEDAVEAVGAELGAKLKSLCGRDRPAPRRAAVIVVAASTGGPSALGDLLSTIRPALPVPMVVVQHMPPTFTGLLADRLTRLTGHDVREAAGGEHLEPGTVWIAPGGRHLEVVGSPAAGRLVLTDGPTEMSCRPSANVLFRSVAVVYGSAALAVVLTGMGRDALAGTELLSAHGARVLVQDESSSVVWGMPGAVARAGLADGVLSLSEMAGAVQDAVGDDVGSRPGADA